MTGPASTGGKIWEGPAMDDLEGRVRSWPSLGHYFLHKLGGEHADAIIFTDFASGRTWTGAEFRHRALAVACALVDEHNFSPGTMVCVSYDNCDHLVILAVAVILAGGCLATSYHKDPYAELLYLARKVEPALLFCHAKNCAWARRLSADLGREVAAIAMDDASAGPSEPSGGSFARLLAYDYRNGSRAWARGLVPVACRERPLEQTVALVSMSSGTTGKPKAVAQTHWNCLADLLAMRSKPGDNFKFSIACCASLDYVSGRLIIFGAIHRGYNAVILNDFEPTAYLRALEQFKCRIIYLGAASFYALITHPQLDQFDLSSLRSVFPMGAKITYQRELAAFFAKHPNIVEVRQGYGASEFGGASMRCVRPGEFLRDANNSGRLFAGFRARLLDPASGRPLGPGQEGLLRVEGPTLFPGYYDREQARANRKLGNGGCLTNNNNNNNDNAHPETDHGNSLESPFVWDSSVFDDQGYYVTGDLAYFNEREELYIVGRQKELMSCRGAKKVLPQELEELLGQHPAVRVACVLGLAHKREPAVQCPRAFVVCKREYYASEAEQGTGRALPLSRKLGAHNEQLEEALRSEPMVHTGRHTLCTLAPEWRRTLAEDLMRFVNERVGWEKHLTGGLVLLDEIPTSRATGKLNKNYLRALTLSQVEVFGDRSG